MKMQVNAFSGGMNAWYENKKTFETLPKSEN
jgi:hypothetical protein